MPKKTTAQKGLDNNPATDGKLFSDTHPYFPKNCSSCPFSKYLALSDRLSGGFSNKMKDCYNCIAVKRIIAHGRLYYIKKEYAEDLQLDRSGEYFISRKYGKRFKVSVQADMTEINPNIRAAKTLLDSFPDMKLEIRRHVLQHGVKNPEYLIDGLLADRKGIESPNGIRSAFQRVQAQGCKCAVIDLDEKMGRYPLPNKVLTSKIVGRKQDFISKNIESCYVIYRNRAINIDIALFDNFEKKAVTLKVDDMLKKLKE